MSKPPRSERMLRAALNLLSGQDDYRPAGLAGKPATADRHTDELAGLSVLLAEDNRFNQQLLRRLLGELGIQADVAANGEEACQLAAQRLYDMILMDIHMPVMGGVEATQNIRKGINHATPIIALTADVFADQDGYFEALGLDGCLFKPASREQLVNILHTWQDPETARHGQHVPVIHSKPAVPEELQAGLHAELHVQLQALRSVCASGNQSGIQDHMHQLKGLADYFNLVAFRTGFEGLQRAVAAGSEADILAATDKLEALLEQESTGS